MLTNSLIFIIFELSTLALVFSEFLEETFIFQKNKGFLVDHRNQLLYTVTATTELQCGLYCQQYGTSCCGGYYNYSSTECKIGISNCCHAEWYDTQGSTVFHRISKFSDSECKTNMIGTDYNGKINKTNAGLTCQAWSVTVPHSHSLDVLLSNEENYCRNPDNSMLGPWCYTTNVNVRWQYCNVPFCVSDACSRECKLNQTGEDYRGTTNITVNGLTCQAWGVNTPHNHFLQRLFTEKNYCRNGDSEPNGPWCYTTDPNVRWEYCDIPMCS